MVQETLGSHQGCAASVAARDEMILKLRGEQRSAADLVAQLSTSLEDAKWQLQGVCPPACIHARAPCNLALSVSFP